jgi:outer membrane lipoprotein-sorting protein
MLFIKRTVFSLILFSFCFLLISFLAPVEKLSLKMISKTLKNGKSISATADLFYQTNGGLLVTRFTNPFEFLVITNNKGEVKMYDPKENSVSLGQNAEMSSEGSFIYQFLNGSIQDMGLKKEGYKITGSRMEDGMMVTVLSPPASTPNVAKVELVHDHYKPIFMGFFDSKQRPTQKIYYSNYTQVDKFNLPLSITEMQYIYLKDKKDSIITKRIYSNVQLNTAVDNTWLNFKIPSNAKVVK